MKLKNKILIGLGIVAVVLIATNPTKNDFKEQTTHEADKRDYNFFVCSVWSYSYPSTERDSATNRRIDINVKEKYLGALGNFFKVKSVKKIDQSQYIVDSTRVAVPDNSTAVDTALVKNYYRDGNLHDFYLYLKYNTKIKVPNSETDFRNRMADDKTATQFYNYVKQEGITVPDNYDKFSSFLKVGKYSARQLSNNSSWHILGDGNSNIEKYYNYLKANNADVPDNIGSFIRTLSDDATAQKYHAYLVKNGFDAPKDYNSFARTLQVGKYSFDKNVTYTQGLYNNLVDYYGKNALPSFDTFDKRMRTEENYRNGVYSNLMDAYGKDAMPDKQTFYNKIVGSNALPVYNFLKQNGFTQKDEQTFMHEYSDNPGKVQKVYTFFKINGFTQKDSATFYNTYFKTDWSQYIKKGNSNHPPLPKGYTEIK